MRPVAALLLAALSGAECERAPPETFAPPSSAPSLPSESASASAPPADGAVSAAPTADAFAGRGENARCIQATPSEAPAPVPAGPAPGCPPDPEAGHLAKLPTVRVGFPDAGGIGVDAELVGSEHDSMRGLMYRKALGADRGMLFDLQVRDDHKFWMHNTCIPLDLLFVDEDGLLVGIVENAPTLNDESRGVGCLSRWVLEVNAGWSRRHGVKAGQHVSLP